MRIDSLVTGILGPIFKLIDKAIPDTAESNRLKAEIEMAVLENKAELQQTMREIAVAEIKGNRFQSSWRPLLSYAVIALFLWIYMVKGIVEAVFGVVIDSGSPDELAMVGTVWASVYGLGRTFEKTGSSINFGRNDTTE